MRKVIILLLGFAAIALAAHYMLKRTADSPAVGASAPKRRLDNVRSKTRSIEDEGQRRADEAAKQAE